MQIYGSVLSLYDPVNVGLGYAVYDYGVAFTMCLPTARVIALSNELWCVHVVPKLSLFS